VELLVSFLLPDELAAESDDPDDEDSDEPEEELPPAEPESDPLAPVPAGSLSLSFLGRSPDEPLRLSLR